MKELEESSNGYLVVADPFVGRAGFFHLGRSVVGD
jgi:hypothetical protein